MKNRLIILRDQLRDSYWFVPALLGLFAILLSDITLRIDGIVLDNLPPDLASSYLGSPAGLRTLLSTIAGSTITVVGLVFSLMMVVLTLASQQYGPLVITNLTRDRNNQFVLGVFTATFIYCMLILRAVRGGEEDSFIPQFSTFVSLGLAISSVAVLVYFIHHIGQSIRASVIVVMISENLTDAINHLFPGQIGQPSAQPRRSSEDGQLPDNFTLIAHEFRAKHSGYLQLVNEDQLLHLARKHNLIIQIDYRPGDFVLPGSILGRFYPYNGPDDLDGDQQDDLVNHIRDALYIGSQRTPAQDVELHFGQLVSVALRALSASINDPYTAVMCIDRLGQALGMLGGRTLPSPYRQDDDGRLRIITRALTFEAMVHLSFDEIHHYGSDDLMVIAHLLHTIRLIGECLHDPHNEAILQQYAYTIWTKSRDQYPDEYAQERLESAYRAAVETLKT